MEFERYKMIAIFSAVLAIVYSLYSLLTYKAFFEVAVALAGTAFNSILLFLIAEDNLKRGRK